MRGKQLDYTQNPPRLEREPKRRCTAHDHQVLKRRTVVEELDLSESHLVGDVTCATSTCLAVDQL